MGDVAARPDASGTTSVAVAHDHLRAVGQGHLDRLQHALALDALGQFAQFGQDLGVVGVACGDGP